MSPARKRAEGAAAKPAKKPTRRRRGPAAPRGPDARESALTRDDEHVAALATRVEKAHGAVLAAYRDPYAGAPLVLASLPPARPGGAALEGIGAPDELRVARVSHARGRLREARPVRGLLLQLDVAPRRPFLRHHTPGGAQAARAMGRAAHGHRRSRGRPREDAPGPRNEEPLPPAGRGRALQSGALDPGQER